MKKLNKALSASIVLLCVIGISFYIFSNYIDRNANAAIGSRLVETARNNALMVRSMIERDQKQLNGTAVRLANATNINTDITAAQTLLKESIQYDSFTHLMVFNERHEIYNESTLVTNEIPITLQDVVKNETYAYVSPQNDRTITINVPIEKDGHVYGVLSGVYDNDKITEMLNYSVFEGQGYFGLLDQAGEVLFGTKKFQEIYHNDNLFDVLKEDNFIGKHTLKEMRKGLKEKQKFFTSYSVENITRYAYIFPLGISDWYIMSAVPAAYMTTYKASIDQAVIILIIFMSTLFFILLVIIIWLSRKARRHLQIDRDGMERIINTVPMPIILSDRNHDIVQMNQTAIDVFAKDIDRIGKSCSFMLKEDTSEMLHYSPLKEQVNGIQTTTQTFENAKFLVTSTKMKDDKNVWNGYIETYQNISDIMESQHALEERTLELETISENLSAGLLITSLNEGFSIIQCNKAYLELIDQREENVIGKPAIQWLLKQEASHVADDIFHQLNEKGNVYLEHLLTHSEGKEVWVSLSGKIGILHHQKVGIWILVDISERKQADKNIRINEERYRVAVENTEDVIVDYDIMKDEMLHNDKVVELYDVDVLVKHPTTSIVDSGIIAPDYISTFLNLFEKIHQGIPKISEDLRTFSKNGEEIWLHVIFTTIFDDHNVPVRAIGVMHDFTAEKKAVMKYEREVQYRKVTMEDAALCYEVDLSDLRFINGHESLVKKYAINKTDAFDAVIKLMLDYLVYEEDRDIVYRNTRPEFLKNRLLTGDNKVEFEYRRVLKRNEISWVLCTIHIYEDERSKHIHLIGYIKDINEAKKLQAHLKQQAETDLLTGLYNKITTQTKIEQHLEDEDFRLSALVIIDLDDFKDINDSFGHAFGDAVLSEVSQRLRKLCVDKELIGRIGGDEFIVYMRYPKTIDDIVEKAESICEMFRQAYTGKGNNYKISGSLGVAVAPRDGASFDTLYRHADIALYSAKKSGKDKYFIYDTSLPPIGSDSAPRRIDENAGKQLSDNIPEYVLRILYEAKDPKLVLNAVLELVARQYKFSRGYVFERSAEKDYWMNTNEWCAAGIPTQKAEMKHVKFGEDGYFESLFNEAGEFMRLDVKELDQKILSKIEGLHVKSFVQFALKKDGVITGFIGFDNCSQHWIPNEFDLENLHMIVMLLDTFIFR